MNHTHQIKLNHYNILISMSNMFIYVHQIQTIANVPDQYLLIGSGKAYEVMRKNLKGARVPKEGNEEYLGHSIIYRPAIIAGI